MEEGGQMTQNLESSGHRSLPPWLRSSLRGSSSRQRVRRLLSDLRLNTVCQAAQCPNLQECWKCGTATFMILGDKCTRDCRFCNVSHAPPAPPEADEPDRLCEAVRRLNLSYVVITSVTRDDLDDFGAGQFVAVLEKLYKDFPGIETEVLTPDFNGDAECLDQVLRACPTVFNHNVETCERLTRDIRSGADYQRSLRVLRRAADISRDRQKPAAIKSGFMLGLGETERDVRDMLAQIRDAGVDILTIGQYLPPSNGHWQVDRYVPPEEFTAWQRIAEQEYDFAVVLSDPLVRSSYKAAEAAEKVRMKKESDKQGC